MSEFNVNMNPQGVQDAINNYQQVLTENGEEITAAGADSCYQVINENDTNQDGTFSAEETQNFMETWNNASEEEKKVGDNYEATNATYNLLQAFNETGNLETGVATIDSLYTEMQTKAAADGDSSSFSQQDVDAAEKASHELDMSTMNQVATEGVQALQDAYDPETGEVVYTDELAYATGNFAEQLANNFGINPEGEGEDIYSQDFKDLLQTLVDNNPETFEQYETATKITNDEEADGVLYALMGIGADTTKDSNILSLSSSDSTQSAESGASSPETKAETAKSEEVKTETTAKQHEAINSYDRDNSERDAIANHDNLNDDNVHYGNNKESEAKGVQLDLDKYWDKYSDKYDKNDAQQYEQYKQDVSNDLLNDINDNFGVAKNEDGSYNYDELKSVYEQIAQNAGINNLDSSKSAKDYVNDVNNALAERSWNESYDDDYVSLNNVQYTPTSKETQASESVSQDTKTEEAPKTTTIAKTTETVETVKTDEPVDVETSSKSFNDAKATYETIMNDANATDEQKAEAHQALEDAFNKDFNNRWAQGVRYDETIQNDDGTITQTYTDGSQINASFDASGNPVFDYTSYTPADTSEEAMAQAKARSQELARENYDNAREAFENDRSQENLTALINAEIADLELKGHPTLQEGTSDKERTYMYPDGTTISYIQDKDGNWKLDANSYSTFDDRHQQATEDLEKAQKNWDKVNDDPNADDKKMSRAYNKLEKAVEGDMAYRGGAIDGRYISDNEFQYTFADGTTVKYTKDSDGNWQMNADSYSTKEDHQKQADEELDKAQENWDKVSNDPNADDNKTARAYNKLQEAMEKDIAYKGQPVDEKAFGDNEYQYTFADGSTAYYTKDSDGNWQLNPERSTIAKEETQSSSTDRENAQQEKFQKTESETTTNRAAANHAAAMQKKLEKDN